MMDSNNLDLNPLIRLKEALEGAQKNTSKMLSKLGNFEHRLANLDEKMRPIQTTTKHYTRAKENISLTLVEVGKTYEYFRIAAEVKNTITAGLTSASQSDFFEALGRLSAAKTFFENHMEIKSSAAELVKIEALLKQGIDSTVSELEKILSSQENSVEYVEDQFHILSPLTPEALRRISEICETLENNKYRAHFKTYQTARVGKMKSELKELETEQASLWLNVQQDGPYLQKSHPFRHYFLTVYWMLRSELQLWGSTFPSHEESLTLFVSTCDMMINEVARTLQGVLGDDRNIRGSNSVVQQSRLFLIRLDVLDVFNNIYEEFRDLCRPDVRQDSIASISLAKIRHTIVQSCSSSIEFLLSSSMSEGFIIDKKKDKNSDNSSEDLSCDLNRTTSNVLYCCKELFKYRAPYQRVLDLMGEFDLTSSIPPPGEVEEFICAALENLFHCLEERAFKFDDSVAAKSIRVKRNLSIKAHAMYESEDKAAEECILGARKHLFLVNNLFAMLQSVHDMQIKEQEDKRNSGSVKKRRTRSGSSLSKLVTLSAVAEKIEFKLDHELQSFCESLQMGFGLLPEDMREFQSDLEKGKNKNGRLLKAKFAMFNTGMEALLAQQGEWRVSSAGLREQLASKMLEHISPTYTEFFTTYSKSNFSKKHMNEYLKFTPEVVDRHLQGFFGRA